MNIKQDEVDTRYLTALGVGKLLEKLDMWYANKKGEFAGDITSARANV